MVREGYWREYRARNRERIRAQERARRTPESRKRRHVAEVARRKRLRNDAPDGLMALPLGGHELIERAMAMTKPPAPGGALRWSGELDYEDRVMAAVEAMLAGTDPAEAMRAVGSEAIAWAKGTVQATDLFWSGLTDAAQ